jgi:hypothetical protein
MTPQASGLVIPGPDPKTTIDTSSKTMTRTPKVVEPLKEPRKWNTKNLGLRLASDFTAGASAACLVAPIITIIDKQVSFASFAEIPS